MTFQAFDVTLSSVVVTQLNEYRSHVGYTKSDYTNDIVWPLAYFSIGQESNLHETEIHLHIQIQISHKLQVNFFPDAFSNLRIHDGPGVLSPGPISCSAAKPILMPV